MYVPNDTLTSWRFGEGPAGQAEDSKKQGCSSIAGLAWPAALFHTQRASPADRIVQQLENDHIPDGEVVERGAFLEVAAMEVDLATGSEPDEPVALPDHQLHETARGCGAASFRRARRAAWRRLSAGGSRRLRHGLAPSSR